MRNKFALILFIIFCIGSGAIVYYGRPVMKLQNNAVNNLNQPAGPSVNNGNSTPLSNTVSGNNFTMAQVSDHNNPSNCWSAVNGSVYDLTDWINRHPGGPQAIEIMCGIDASDLFNGQHGYSRRAQSALALLKIGNLQL